MPRVPAIFMPMIPTSGARGSAPPILCLSSRRSTKAVTAAGCLWKCLIIHPIRRRLPARVCATCGSAHPGLAAEEGLRGEGSAVRASIVGCVLLAAATVISPQAFQKPACEAAPAEGAGLEAGFAETDITPKLGRDLV